MKARIIEHLLSIVLVSAVLLGLLAAASSGQKDSQARASGELRDLAELSGLVNFRDPFEKVLLGEVLDLYYPGQHDKNAGLVSRLEQYKNRQLGKAMEEAHVKERLTPAKLASLLLMYAKFLLAYVLVMALTYYGVQTFGTWRFIKRRQRSEAQEAAPARGAGPLILSALRKAGAGIGHFILFCPAYVIAYSIRTEFGTDSLVFMVLLGVISNGLLVMYSNRFYAFLVAESRKGYVETAVAKNLRNSYSQKRPDGIPLKAVFRLSKRFDGHVFGHIFRNARFQYLSSIKEQASFLITGLIIIEMALNIHGHLNYEMLRQILYRNYDIVIAIILCIFYTVKLTEVAVDLAMHRESLRYENR